MAPKACVQGWGIGKGGTGEEGMGRGRGEPEKRGHVLCLVMYGHILVVSGSPA